MSSLILVSPRKTGKIVNGVLDGSKFTQLARTSAMGLSVHSINFYGGHFFMNQHSSASRFYLFDDPTQGIGDFRNQGTPNLLYSYGYGGVGYGDDDATLIAGDGFTSRTQAAISWDFGYSWTLVSIANFSAFWRTAAKATGIDGTQAWLICGGAMARSLDNGASWVRLTSTQLPIGPYSVAVNGTMTVTGAATAFYWSTDAGATWTKGTSTVPTNRAIFATANSVGYSFIRYAGDRWWAHVNYSAPLGAIVCCSLNGKDWFPVALPDIGVQLINIFYAEGLYVITGINTNSYLTSLDGVNWTVAYFPAGWMCGGPAAYGNGKFIFAPYGSAATTPYQVYTWY